MQTGRRSSSTASSATTVRSDSYFFHSNPHATRSVAHPSSAYMCDRCVRTSRFHLPSYASRLKVAAVISPATALSNRANRVRHTQPRGETAACTDPGGFVVPDLEQLLEYRIVVATCAGAGLVLPLPRQRSEMCLFQFSVFSSASPQTAHRCSPRSAHPHPIPSHPIRPGMASHGIASASAWLRR